MRGLACTSFSLECWKPHAIWMFYFQNASQSALHSWIIVYFEPSTAAGHSIFSSASTNHFCHPFCQFNNIKRLFDKSIYRLIIWLTNSTINFFVNKFIGLLIWLVINLMIGKVDLLVN